MWILLLMNMQIQQFAYIEMRSHRDCVSNKMQINASNTEVLAHCVYKQKGI
jgi:hypothetical protein